MDVIKQCVEVSTLYSEHETMRDKLRDILWQAIKQNNNGLIDDLMNMELLVPMINWSFVERSIIYQCDIDISNRLFSKMKENNGCLLSTELDEAVCNDHIELVSFLVKNNIESINALGNAASNGYLEIVKLLVENKAKNYYALESAARNGHFKVVQYLWNAGIRYTYSDKDEELQPIVDALLKIE